MPSPENKFLPRSEKLFYFLVALLVINISARAQDPGKTSSFSSLEITAKQANRLTIKYNPTNVIYSFLVLIIDPDGNNIFLESKNRFTGTYFKMVDLPASKKGEYSVTIICDDEKLNKKILVK